ncbi:hypothetical protein QFC24_007073 [Naganishia onofrii]|uniref:Uncharacterized protein n=1 Tax=Naganishia onofrii TaxID=1851511 RepID=A0ACC2WU50_9TREE|nr:hypothetical protein QFC24_007073 [Naganishia onofrii]
MSYPSINSVAGSASRNRDAILDALAPFLEQVVSSSKGGTSNKEEGPERVLEISSGSGEHVVAMSRRWPDVELWPSERNEEQLQPGGWVAVYGAFMQDDGTFASEGDAKFHERFTSLHPDFGLRKVPDVEAVARCYGFVMEQRIPMPAGNWMLVFRLRGTKGKQP